MSEILDSETLWLVITNVALGVVVVSAIVTVIVASIRESSLLRGSR